jgi:O-antigen polymerase
MIVPVSNNVRPLICKWLLLLLLFSTLLKSGLFVNAFYTHLFAFILTGCITMAGAGFYLLRNGSVQLPALSLAALVMLPAWAGYIFIHNHFHSGTLQSLFMAASLITCFAMVLLLKASAQSSGAVFTGIVAIATLQAGICLLQAAGIAAPGNDFFKVAGTWLNPNIAAMYIALALPVALYNVLCTAAYRRIYSLLVLLMAIALLLLQSRTAILGAAAMAVMMLQWRYGLLHRFLHKLSSGAKQITLAVLMMVMVFAGHFAYTLKKASADSRAFIWHTSIKMLAQKPLTGYGYGSFEKNYNLFQAAHFRANPDVETDRQNAAHTKMGYNEFLQSAIEGGLPGAAFLTVFLLLLLRSAYLFLKKNHALHYQKAYGPGNAAGAGVQYLLIAATGIAGVTMMSLVNFTILTVPVMSVFILYAAVIISTAYRPGTIPVSKAIIKITATGLIITGLLLGSYTARTAYSQHTIRHAVNLAVNKQYAEATAALDEVTEKYRDNAEYYHTRGNIAYFNNNKTDALAAYKKAAGFTSTPELYQQMGNCCAELQQYQEAVMQYETALNIQPNRITPRWLLMTVYIRLRDSANTLRLAKEIVSMEEKLPSPQIDMYKKTATNIIKKLQQKNSL